MGPDAFVNYSSAFYDFIITFYNSTFFDVIKFILGIYAVVLFIDIILLLIQRGLSSDLKETIHGMNIPKELVKDKHKNKLKIQWEAIRKELESDNEDDYKAAVISADSIIDNLLKGMGYAGENMEQRLANIPDGQIENLDDLKLAHQVKKRIVEDSSFKIDRQAAHDTISSYEHFLKLFEVLD